MPVPVASGDPPGRRAGYAAAACAFLFAAVSFYWGSGGTFGLDLVGQEAVELSESRDVWIFLVLWAVGLLKVAGGLLALALVQSWGQRLFSRWMLLVAGWGGSALLVLYGGSQMAVQLLVVTGIVKAPSDIDRRGFYGHLYLWDPWFVIWGLLLGTTAYYYSRSQRRLASANR